MYNRATQKDLVWNIKFPEIEILEMKILNLKSNHKAVKEYYEAIANLSDLGVLHEGAVSPAFATLLQTCAKQFDRSLIEQYHMKVKNHNISIDGALVNSFNMPHGFWEAKDSSDDLDKEIKKKFAVGYPENNILFRLQTVLSFIKIRRKFW